MKNVSKLLLISILLLVAGLISCTKEGPMGPEGPQGEQGEQGETGIGATTSVITGKFVGDGTFGLGDYYVYSSKFKEGAITQVYISSSGDSWIAIPTNPIMVIVSDGLVAVFDTISLDGWYYLILVLES